MTGWKVVDPIQRVGAGGWVVTYERLRSGTLGLSGWPFIVPAFPMGYPVSVPFPFYPIFGYRVRGDEIQTFTQEQAENLATLTTLQMIAHVNSLVSQGGLPWDPTRRGFVTQTGIGILNRGYVAVIHPVSWQRRTLYVQGGSAADAVNAIPAIDRQSSVNALTGLPANLAFSPFPVFINNAFRLISVERG